MLLYALCLHPLLRMLENKLPGIQIGHRERRTCVVAYADDVKIFVTSPTDFKTIYEAIQIYERASGTRLNPQNSYALAIGKWNTPTTELYIEFQSRIKILGVTFGSSIKESTTATWTHLTEAIRAQARKAYARGLCLAQRIQYVQSCLLAKICTWHKFSHQTKHTQQQLTTTCMWYTWQGMTFRVPITKLHRQKTQGGWAMLDVAGKCRTLLLYRMWILKSREGSVTASWLEHWTLKEPIANPQTGTQSRTN